MANLPGAFATTLALFCASTVLVLLVRYLSELHTNWLVQKRCAANWKKLCNVYGEPYANRLLADAERITVTQAELDAALARRAFRSFKNVVPLLRYRDGRAAKFEHKDGDLTA